MNGPATTAIRTGHGYGVDLIVPDPLTADTLAAAADGDGQVAVWAYAPNAGHPWDTANAGAVERILPGGSWVRHRTPFTPLRIYTIGADDRDALEAAADALHRVRDGEHLDDAAARQEEWDDYVRLTDDAARDIPGGGPAVRAWLDRNGAYGWVVDDSGVCVPDLDRALAALQEPDPDPLLDLPAELDAPPEGPAR